MCAGIDDAPWVELVCWHLQVGLDEQAALHQLAGDSTPWDRAHFPI